MQIAPGTQLDRYVIQGILGEGAMAVVYRAQHAELGSLHALKRLKIPGRKVSERLVLEGRLQSSLQHPNVVSVTDLITIDGTPALVMEFVAGPTLADLLCAQELSLNQCDALARDLLKGVAAAHAHGMVHRDLKPNNILIGVTEDSLVPKVADFGLAKVVEGETEKENLTRTGTTMGTPAYMAPEQIRDSSNVDDRADVFSLGAILYELVAGRPCFVGDSIMAIWERICAGDCTPISEVYPGIPERMKNAIEGALRVDREERFQSVAELFQAWCANPDGAHIEVPGRQSLDFWPEEIRFAAASMAPTLEKTEGDSFPNPDDDRSTIEFVADDPHTPSELSPDSRMSLAPPADSPPPPASQNPQNKIFVLLLGLLCLVVSGMLLLSLGEDEEDTSSEHASESSNPSSPSETPALQGPFANSEETAPFAVRSHASPSLLLALGNLGNSASATRSGPQFSVSLDRALDALNRLSSVEKSSAPEQADLTQDWTDILGQSPEPMLELSYLVLAHPGPSAKETKKGLRSLQAAQPGEPIWTLLELGLLSENTSLHGIIALAEDGLQRFPEKTDIRLILADALVKLGRFGEARPHIERALREDESQASARTLLAAIAIQEDEEADRIQQFMIALGDTVPLPDQLLHLREHGRHLANRGRLGEAEKLWNFCIDTAVGAGEFDAALHCSATALDATIWLRSAVDWVEWQDKVRTAITHPSVDPKLKQLYATQLMASEALVAASVGDIPRARDLFQQVSGLRAQQNPLDPKGAYAQDIQRELAIASRDPALLNAYLETQSSTATANPNPKACTSVFNQARVLLALDQHTRATALAKDVLAGNCFWDANQHFVQGHLRTELARRALLAEDMQTASRYIQDFQSSWPSGSDSDLPLMQLMDEMAATLSEAP